jgi:hypothetical protein
MAVFREVQIEWEGETHTFVPSMALLRRIETNGVSIMRVAYEVSQGKPQTSHMAWILFNVLSDAGVDADEEELFADLIAGDHAKVMALYRAVMDAITPQTGKKPDAPSK